jgi:hypothetical protein
MATNQKTVGVVGAGLMGAEIAFIYALSGRDIILCDKTAMALSGAKERLASIYEKVHHARYMRLTRNRLCSIKSVPPPKSTNSPAATWWTGRPPRIWSKCLWEFNFRRVNWLYPHK